MTEKNHYRQIREKMQISEKIKMGSALRLQIEDTARRNESKNEVELALFTAELLHKYAVEIAEKTKDDEDFVWYLINAQADCLAQNLRGTMIRLKMCLSDYKGDDNDERKESEATD